MAKLLIVEDHLRMAWMIQEYVQKINPLFTPENTFCFPHRGSLELRPLCKLPNDGSRASLAGKQKDVFSKVFRFLNKWPQEDVLILIDVLLNSQNISAPSFERYRADHEYSCELYAELLRVKNGKKVKGCGNIDPNKFYHIIYSRSDASIGVVVAVLSELSQHQSEADRNYFPKECARFENISWCRNGYDITDPDFMPQEGDGVPLKLPEEYKEFIRGLK